MTTVPNSPDKQNPDHLALRASPRPVTRLNRRSLALIAGALSAALLAATVWSLQSQHRGAAPAPELHISDRISPPDKLESVAHDYSEIPPQLGEPRPGDWGVAQARQEAQAGNVTAVAPAATGRKPGSTPASASHVADAADSPLNFKIGGGTAMASAPDVTAQTAPADPAMNAFAALPERAAAIDPTLTQNQQVHKEAFLNDRGATATRASGTWQPSPSPYAIMAGTILSAALVTGIKSDLPGQIIATVTEPVYDSKTGQTLLIPQGSRLIGEYDSQIAFGQRRVLVVWTRLVMPDTTSITLDRIPGVDGAGYAGLEDGVDWHWGRVFAGAAVSTLIGVGAELAAPDRNSSDGRVVIAARDSVQDSVNQVGQEITRRNLNVQPTLTERPGLPLRVIVNKDLILRPYQSLFFGG